MVVGFAWALALPYEGFWKDAYVDENAIQPAQVGLCSLEASNSPTTGDPIFRLVECV